MTKRSIVNIRIESEIKTKAEKIFDHLGLSSSEAVRLFYAQVCLHKGLPFELKIPNQET
jgi:DNA-damage-inducible protein J